MIVVIYHSTAFKRISEFHYLCKRHLENMTAIELKTILIHRISEINDVSFLKALITILDIKTETGVIQFTPEQLDEIIASKKEIEQGLFIENSALDKEVRQWLNAG